ncbi:hypothetical protein ACFO25_05425 [Paenactinomyces guangxiensis]|uniref:Uncharacterized protein n=1 Tax=Paenactinomyces guangxiensis TaxID=1490290 RepID=A0A7W2A7A5_9BACL|nr:hypothetical protein [Paenactinomyces guangxiensis]MBA4494326.1 hypothetical protein [Paenactinomyces guangxiensis]MBH8590821.1 hypothetical protein [Paenactinomyces guangxiensis]
MAKYYGKYEMNETQTPNAMTWLQLGDEVHLVNRVGKKMGFTVKNTYKYNNKIVYVTDRFGIVYADELRNVPVPSLQN